MSAVSSSKTAGVPSTDWSSPSADSADLPAWYAVAAIYATPPNSLTFEGDSTSAWSAWRRERRKRRCAANLSRYLATGDSAPSSLVAVALAIEPSLLAPACLEQL